MVSMKNELIWTKAAEVVVSAYRTLCYFINAKMGHRTASLLAMYLLKRVNQVTEP